MQRVAAVFTADAAHEEASLRERKKSATRAALRRAAVELIAGRGLAAVTVEDIAASANVSPRTFFNYFASKEEAVSGFDPSMRAELAQRLARRPPRETPLQALRAAMLESLSSFDPDPDELLRRLRLVRSDPHLLAHHVSAWTETERVLAATLAARTGGDPEHDRYIALLVATTLTASRVAMLAWCESGGRMELAQELAFHLDVLGAGLAEPKRRSHR